MIDTVDVAERHGADDDGIIRNVCGVYTTPSYAVTLLSSYELLVQPQVAISALGAGVVVGGVAAGGAATADGAEFEGPTAGEGLLTTWPPRAPPRPAPRPRGAKPPRPPIPPRAGPVGGGPLKRGFTGLATFSLRSNTCTAPWAILMGLAAMAFCRPSGSVKST